MRKYSIKTSRLVFVLALTLCAPFYAWSEGSVSVQGIDIAGNQRVDSEAIKLQIKKQSGTITTEEVTEDIKTLYSTGFFDQVEASVVESGGRTLLRFTVAEKPLVRKAYVKGNKEVSEGDLSEIVKFGEKRFLDKARIDGFKRSMISLYQAKGYNDASVDASVVPVGENQVDITFIVSEGSRYKLRKVQFKGLNEIDADDLRDVMQTKRYKWYSSWLFGTGRLNNDMLDADRSAIRQYFLDNGFIEATISDPQTEVDKDKAEIVVSFLVNEGKRYKFGSITASGDLVDGDKEKTLEEIDSKSGETFSAAKIRQDSFKISDKFGDEGYAFANVQPLTDVQEAEGVVNINFTSSKGKVVSVNRINIFGNDKTYDNVIRRELKVQEADQYSSSKVKRSQKLLERLGYFDEVSISNEPAPGADNAVDLNVNVKEAKSTGSFSIGAGYSTSDGPIATAKLSENNILGTGRRVDLSVDVGTETNNATLTLSDRKLNDTNLSGSIEGFRSERKFDDFNRVMTGGALAFGYPLEEVFGESLNDINAGLRYELLNVDISDVDDSAATLIKASEGSAVSSAINPTLSRNTINNPLNPRTGSNQVLSYERSGLGGDVEYELYEARNTFYYPLFDSWIGEFVFSDRLRYDYGKSLNDDAYPLFKRFFPGGINSVRGYESRSLGPKEGDSEYGGSKQFVNNAELIFPLINSAGIKGVFFYDMGQAYDDNQSLDFSELRKSWGFGIRWMSPLGPLRFEFGFPIQRREGEDRMQPAFSFGVPF